MSYWYYGSLIWALLSCLSALYIIWGTRKGHHGCPMRTPSEYPPSEWGELLILSVLWFVVLWYIVLKDIWPFLTKERKLPTKKGVTHEKETVQ